MDLLVEAVFAEELLTLVLALNFKVPLPSASSLEQLIKKRGEISAKARLLVMDFNVIIAFSFVVYGYNNKSEEYPTLKTIFSTNWYF